MHEVKLGDEEKTRNIRLVDKYIPLSEIGSIYCFTVSVEPLKDYQHVIKNTIIWTSNKLDVRINTNLIVAQLILLFVQFYDSQTISHHWIFWIEWIVMVFYCRE